MEIEIGIPMMKIVSTSENKKNRQRVIDEWQLGPEKASQPAFVSGMGGG